jgi:AraC-like DNA-binding protein
VTLSDAIKEIGRRHRLSPTDIAAVLGKSERTLHRWMRGEVDHPPRGDLMVIKAMLEHGELVSICLGELYDELPRSKKRALARIRQQRPRPLLLDWQR